MVSISDSRYILYARPRGSVGEAVAGYWDRVRANKDLCHLFVRQYPPHVTLTSFFSKNEIKKKIDLNKSLEKAVQKTKVPIDIAIKGLKQSLGFDRLEIESKYLLKVSQAFAKKIGLASSKAKKGIDSPFHLTLKQKSFKDEGKNREIQKLQKSLRDKIGKGPSKWSLCLYKSESAANGQVKLTLLKKVIL